MKSREFIVPLGLVPEFSEMMIDNELTNEIVGKTKHDAIIIEISYVPAEKEFVEHLTELLEDYKEEDED